MEARELTDKVREILDKHPECRKDLNSLSFQSDEFKDFFDFSECKSLEHFGYVLVIRHDDEYYYISMSTNLKAFNDFLELYYKNNEIEYVESI